MLAHVTPAALARWFAGAPDTGIWIGLTDQLLENVEVVPFMFNGERYLMLFSSAFVGKQFTPERVAEIALIAAGVELDANNRIIKFFRADAQEESDVFNPDKWKLGSARQIFQFGDVLTEVVWGHATDIPAVRQYFFAPVSASLAKFYHRAFINKSKCCQDLKFESILDPEQGGFYGYQRT